MLTIGRLAKQAQLTPDSIRFYEKLGLVCPVSRTHAGYRLYCDETLGRLTFIKHAQRCGFSLADVKELLAAQEGTARDPLCLKLSAKRAELEDTMVALGKMCEALSCLIERARSAPGIPPCRTHEARPPETFEPGARSEALGVV